MLVQVQGEPYPQEEKPRQDHQRTLPETATGGGQIHQGVFEKLGFRGGVSLHGPRLYRLLGILCREGQGGYGADLTGYVWGETQPQNRRKMTNLTSTFYTFIYRKLKWRYEKSSKK